MSNHLNNSIKPYARVAYAQGWARSGGPMTDRVKAGCAVAIQLAVENSHEPLVIEATLQLGNLEGTWAAVMDRREKLITKHVDLVTTAWRRSAHRLDVRAAVRQFRRSLGLAEAAIIADPSVSTIDNTAHRRLVANGIATIVSSSIAGDDAQPVDREEIIKSTAAALADAEAEGYAGSVVTGAHQLGTVAPDFDIVFTDAHQALGDLGSHWGDATGWVARMTSGNAHDLGGRLSALAADGADYDKMVEDAMDVIGGDDVGAVSTLVDLAMSQSFSRGALSLYSAMGVQQVDFVTAGGYNVCKICMDAESRNPWDRQSAPAPGLHPHCRCVLQATDPMQGLSRLLAQWATAA